MWQLARCVIWHLARCGNWASWQPLRRPATSFFWLSNPCKSFKHILWPNAKWYIITALVVLFLVVFVLVFLYTFPVRAFSSVFPLFCLCTSSVPPLFASFEVNSVSQFDFLFLNLLLEPRSLIRREDEANIAAGRGRKYCVRFSTAL